MKADLFHSCGYCRVFLISWHIEWSTFTASSFRSWNSSTEIPSSPLALSVVMLPRLTWLHIPGYLALGKWSHHYGYLGHEDLQFCCVFLVPLLNIFCFCQVHTISVLYWAHLCMNCSLGISNFLEVISSLSLSIFSSISLQWSLRKAFLSLLDIFWNSVFRWVYLSFSPLPFTSLVFWAICKVSSNNYFAFLHFFFLVMVLIISSCSVMNLWP